jgi:hypothetical protein
MPLAPRAALFLAQVAGWRALVAALGPIAPVDASVRIWAIWPILAIWPAI